MAEPGESHQSAEGNYIAQAAPGGTASVNHTVYQTVYASAARREVDEETLRKAERRLAALPLEEIPSPAPLPSGSQMSYHPNPFFVGRQDDLRKLAQTLKSGKTAAIGQIAAVTGLGGIGKTQLACEVVHRYGQYFAGGVFWLSFADPKAIPNEVAGCGGSGALNLKPDFKSLNQADQIKEILFAWQSALPRLLIFDNCEEEALLAKWRPPTGGCRVLLTSRRSEWDPALAVQPLPLELLRREESIALLRKHRDDLTESEADAIAEEMSDLPLALHLAGSFLAHYRHAVTPTDYLAQLRNQALLTHPSLVGRGSSYSPTGHECHVGRTFALSYDRLDRADPIDSDARALLARAAYFAPGEPIPRPLILATLKMPGADVEAVLRRSDAIGRLTDLGLLKSEAGGGVSLHRLIQLFVRQAETDRGAQEAVEEALLGEANRLIDAWDSRSLLVWQLHLRYVTDGAIAREDEQAAALCNTLGVHLWQIGDYAGAQPLHQLALKIRVKVLGPKHPNVAASLNNLATLYKDQGRDGEAEPLLLRALKICVKVLGPEHPNVAASLNNLATLYGKQGRDAEPFHQRALKIWERVLGPEHPDVATSLDNLALLFSNQGRDEEAEPLHQRALQIREKVLRPEHPDVASSLHNLAALYGNQGRDEEAEPLYQRALQISEKVLGLEHPDVATTLYGLALLFSNQGRDEEAEPLYQRALQIREKVLGREHPDVAILLENYSVLLSKMGRHREQTLFDTRAKTIREKHRGAT